MNDSVDIEKASERLQTALSLLVQRLEPLLDRVKRLEAAVSEGQQFNEDRARLARELDEAQSSLAVTTAREANISQLAAKTRQELDDTIRDIQNMIKSSGG